LICNFRLQYVNGHAYHYEIVLHTLHLGYCSEEQMHLTHEQITQMPCFIEEQQLLPYRISSIK